VGALSASMMPSRRAAPKETAQVIMVAQTSSSPR
jgi:hypothetical protein